MKEEMNGKRDGGTESTDILDRPVDEHHHTTGEKSRAGRDINISAGQTPPRGSLRAALRAGEVLFLFKIPADDSFNADTPLAGCRPGAARVEKERESVEPRRRASSLLKSWRI